MLQSSGNNIYRVEKESERERERERSSKVFLRKIQRNETRLTKSGYIM